MKKFLFILSAVCCSLLMNNCNKENKELKIMSFNILHGIDYPHELKSPTKERIVNLDPIVDIVKRQNPDVINFNEIYGRHIEFGDQVQYIANKLGYYAYFVHAADITKDKNYYGGALMSRYPIRYARTHHIPAPSGATEDFEPRAIGEAYIEISKDEQLHVFESHFGLSDDEYALTLETLTPLVKDQSKTIFMGDLNLYPESEYIKQIESMMDEALNTNALTFPSIKVDPVTKEKIGGADRHIDYIFKSRDITCLDSKVLSDEIYSDHLPVVVTIKL